MVGEITSLRPPHWALTLVSSSATRPACVANASNTGSIATGRTLTSDPSAERMPTRRSVKPAAAAAVRRYTCPQAPNRALPSAGRSLACNCTVGADEKRGADGEEFDGEVRKVFQDLLEGDF